MCYCHPNARTPFCGTWACAKAMSEAENATLRAEVERLRAEGVKCCDGEYQRVLARAEAAESEATRLRAELTDAHAEGRRVADTALHWREEATRLKAERDQYRGDSFMLQDGMEKGREIIKRQHAELTRLKAEANEDANQHLRDTEEIIRLKAELDAEKKGWAMAHDLYVKSSAELTRLRERGKGLVEALKVARSRMFYTGPGGPDDYDPEAWDKFHAQVAMVDATLSAEPEGKEVK